MSTQKPQGGMIILITLLIALILQVAPVPAIVENYRPSWLVMCILYWSMALPHRTSVGVAWIFGLILDLLLGGTLGVRALSLALASYIVAFNFRVLRNFSLWQQAGIIMLITLMYRLIVYWGENLSQGVMLQPTYLYGAAVNLLLWPWVFLVLRRIRRHFHVK